MEDTEITRKTAAKSGSFQCVEKDPKKDVIANQSADWCGNLLNRQKTSQLLSKNVGKSGRFPRQCEHWLGTT